jgi:hypothetical protein
MRWFKRALRAVFLALLLALGAALFFLLVIMGDAPQEAAAPETAGQVKIFSFDLGRNGDCRAFYG